MISYLGSFLSVLKYTGFVLLALLILVLMIVIHELGHYTAGKIFKFKINEFSIGFGKAIYKKVKKNGEVFAIRCVPLGGYCAFEGEDEDGESPDSFNKQAWWKRLIVLFSGAFFNFLSAILMCVVLLSVVGQGYSRIESVQGTISDYLQVGDVITHVNGQQCSFIRGDFNYLTAGFNDNETVVVLTVQRVENGKKQTLEVPVKKYLTTTETDENGQEQTVYKFGVKTSYQNYNFGTSLLKAVPYAFQLAWECLVIIGNLFLGKGLKNLGGPITTIGSIATASSKSLLNLVVLCPLIAINLAVFNWLPIPALDGARMVFVLIEAIRKKPINRELEAKIHTYGLIALFGLVILVDILQLFVFH